MIQFTGLSTAAMLGIALNVVGGEEQVVFAVRLDNGRRPDGISYPFYILDVQYVRVLGPGHQIFGRKGIDKGLLQVLRVDGEFLGRALLRRKFR